MPIFGKIAIAPSLLCKKNVNSIQKPLPSRFFNQNKSHVVFVFWGKEAQKKIPSIDTIKHTILKSSYPAPFSAKYSFFGSRPFALINSALKAANREPIDWRL
ncbi:MAG: hypothetical protein ACFBSE_20860 [Prochloraceae cyanobacterium]